MNFIVISYRNTVEGLLEAEKTQKQLYYQNLPQHR